MSTHRTTGPGPVDVSSLDGVRWLRLARPEQMNALSSDLVATLHEQVERFATDDTCRVAVITGEGPAFSAGADLKEALQVTGDGTAFRGWLLAWRDAFRAIERCPKPVLAAVNGTTLAGGLELALSCDLIVASSAARIGDGHVRYGLVPGGGGSKRLPDAVGVRQARWLMYSGELLRAEEAKAIGLVAHVVPAEDFDAEVGEIARTLATRSPAALRFMKRMSATSRVGEDDLDLEIEAAAHVITGPEAQEGLAAFVEKRDPRFV